MANTFVDKDPISLASVFEEARESRWSRGEEELIVDTRSAMRSAQMFEDKLSGMLKGDFQMVSQLRLRSLIAHRP